MTGPTNVERGRDVRARLLNTARELVSEIGWNAVSTRNLADRAGVRAGLVHYHFESLQALLRQAAVEGMRATLDEFTGTLHDTDGPADWIVAMLAHLDRYAADAPASLLFVESYLAATRDPLLREQLGELILGFRTELAATLSAAGHPAPEQTAVVVLAAVDGFMLHKGLDPGLSAAAISPVLAGLATTGVVPGKPRIPETSRKGTHG